MNGISTLILGMFSFFIVYLFKFNSSSDPEPPEQVICKITSSNEILQNVDTGEYLVPKLTDDTSSSEVFIVKHRNDTCVIINGEESSYLIV